MTSTSHIYLLSRTRSYSAKADRGVKTHSWSVGIEDHTVCTDMLQKWLAIQDFRPDLNRFQQTVLHLFPPVAQCCQVDCWLVLSATRSPLPPPSDHPGIRVRSIKCTALPDPLMKDLVSDRGLSDLPLTSMTTSHNAVVQATPGQRSIPTSIILSPRMLQYCGGTQGYGVISQSTLISSESR